MSTNDLHILKWYADATFAMHLDFKSHMGGGLTLGVGMSHKQKLNTTSSTIAELVEANNLSGPILWTKLFMEAQGYKIKKNILYQDNKSTILLENNGKASSSSRMRAVNIRYFFLTDQVNQRNLSISYCPTGDMIADFFSKPMQGNLFHKFCNQIMGYTSVSSPM